MSDKVEMFNIKIVHDKFQASLYEDDDVDLELYLESFEELSKFFSLMGSIFNFVNNDLQEKINHLKNLLKHNHATHTYKTVKSMITHEKENGLLYKTDFVSGSRTLLRIHRGLDFIQLFLKKIGELHDADTTSAACGEAYDLTLGNHHSFFIRCGAKMAMYTLPTRGQLLKRVCIEDEEIERALSMLPKTLEVLSIVYTRIETLYTAHNLHALP